MPDNPDMALASMGIYVFNTDFLMDELRRDAETPGSSRDFGKDIIPYIVENGKAVAHRFTDSCVRETPEQEAYWRDVGTVDAYWQANIDLTDILPDLDLYDRSWPIWTYAEIRPPAKFVHNEDGRRGMALSSLVSGDCIISGSNCTARCCSPASCAVPIPGSTRPWCCPNVSSVATPISPGWCSTAASRFPPDWLLGEDPELDASRFRRTESGDLPDHPGHARPSGVDLRMKVLSVASEVYPLIKTGGLADVAGALPASAGGSRRRHAGAVPGYKQVMAKTPSIRCALRGGSTISSASAPRSWPARLTGWSIWFWTRRIFLTATAVPTPTHRQMP
jgi:hypothetical protein